MYILSCALQSILLLPRLNQLPCKALKKEFLPTGYPLIHLGGVQHDVDEFLAEGN